MDSIDGRVGALASGQAGAVSRRQLADLGVDDRVVRRRVASGAWRVASPQVITVVGAPSGWYQQVWVGVLSGGHGAAASFATAAALHRFDGFPRHPVEVTVPHPRHLSVPGVRLRQATDLWSDMVDRRAGLPATTPARTIVDLAAVTSRGRLGLVLDDAVARRRVSLIEVGRVFDRIMRRGKRGLLRMAAVLDARGPATVPPGSVLERRLLDLLAAWGEPAPVRQFAHPTPTGRVGFVDLAYPDCRLIVEVDGRTYHSRLQDLRRDRARDTEAARAGWQTLRVGFEEIEGDPSGVVASIRETRQIRLAQLDGTRV